MRRTILFSLLTLLASAQSQADEVIRIAVAANLLPVMEQISAAYQQQSSDRIQLAGGSSGAFFEQIQRGAPFDLFYAADAERPQKLAQGGYSEAPQTYACGRLALWTPNAAPNLQHLPAGKIAIAQPDTAPYGKAALQVLQRSGVLERYQARLVYGQDVGQAFQFVTSQNAPSGLVALSQLTAAQTPPAQYQRLDNDLYEPLVQQRVLIAKGSKRAAAERFMRFFDSQRSTLTMAGYALPGEAGCAAN